MLLAAAPTPQPSNNFFSARSGLSQMAIVPGSLFTIAHCYSLSHMSSWARWRASGENETAGTFPRDIKNSADRNVPMTVKGRGQPTALPSRALKARAVARRSALPIGDFAGGTAAAPTDDYWPQAGVRPRTAISRRPVAPPTAQTFDPGAAPATDDYESARALPRRRSGVRPRPVIATVPNGDDDAAAAAFRMARPRRPTMRAASAGDLEPFGGQGGQDTQPPPIAAAVSKRRRLVVAPSGDSDQPAAPVTDDHESWRALVRISRTMRRPAFAAASDLEPFGGPGGQDAPPPPPRSAAAGAKRRAPAIVGADKDQPSAPATDDHGIWRAVAGAIRRRGRPATLLAAGDQPAIDPGDPSVGLIPRIWRRLRAWWPFGGDAFAPAAIQVSGQTFAVEVSGLIRARAAPSILTAEVGAVIRPRTTDRTYRAEVGPTLQPRRS